ncbi:MAG TPA: hypothetical protein VEQ85_07475, partial [Lacipirellulaceae bacterium]|nr:hypothetical protein [Lacipirellulaceae bacterium]
SSAEDAPVAAAVAPAEPLPATAIAGGHPRCSGAAHPELCTPRLNQKFLETFPSIAPLERSAVLRFPPVTHDNVVRAPAGQQVAQRFVTSSQCMSCHAGLLEPFGPTMFAPTSASTEYGAPGVHLSPYGEWRWTPMGLAGRDPVFYAQLESEIEMMRGDFADDPQRGEELAAELVATCLRCHGVMGKHQYEFDHGDRAGAFGLASVMHGADSAGVAAGGVDAIAGGVDHSRYGALARDGVSCAVSHQMVARQQPAEDPREYLEFFLETSTTGNFQLGPPGEIYGPFEDKELAPYAMEHAMGMKPRHNAYIQSSRMCASCHVVNLPIVDKPEPATAQSQLVAAEQNPRFREFHHHVEQATYLEWLNSEFENELNPGNPAAKTCQDCHMSRDYHNDQAPLHLDRIETQIAAIQDSTYPEAENLASREELEIRVRKEGYARHNFRGLNMFLLEMFNQFDDLLGVRKYDFMTGSTGDIPHAMADFQRQARNDVASRAVDAAVDDGTLTARVDVRN